MSAGVPMDQIDPRIDLYLDGALEGEALAAFERELRGSESLRRQLEAQERIDAGLKDLFEYRAEDVKPLVAVAGRVDGSAAGAGRVSGPVAGAHPQRGGAVAGRLRWYATAAAVLLAGAVVLSVVLDKRFSIDRSLSPASVYAKVNQPEFVCTTDAEFAAAVKKRLGQPLVLAAVPGVSALGWAYGDNYEGNIVGDKTMVLITDVRGQKVLVFMDRLGADRKLEMPAESGLHIFRREEGRLVLYEVTPLEKPEVIGNLHRP